MTKVYFDMDGVIADWEEGFKDTFPNMSIEEYNRLPKDLKAKYKDNIANDKSYYYRLKPMKAGIGYLRYLVDAGYDVEILTSCGEINTKEVVKQKKRWVKKHLSGLNIKFNYTTKSEDKARYATKDTVLIDDREKSIVPFKRAGGKVIHYRDGITNVIKELFRMKLRESL